MEAPTTPGGMKGNESTPGWEWPVTRDLFGDELTTASNDLWRDDESGNIGDVASQIGRLNFPNLGVGNPFDGLPNVDLPNVDIPNVEIPAVGIPNTGATQVTQQIFDKVMGIDWQNTDFEVLRRIIEAVLELITNTIWGDSDHSDIDWMNMNTTVLPGMIPTIDNRTLNIITVIGREFLSNMNRSEASMAALNSLLPQGLPRIQLSTDGSSDFILNWNSFNLTSLPLPDNFRQAITLVMDWQNTNWSDINAIPEFIRELISLFLTTDMENIGADDILPILPIPDGIRDMITMAMNVDWDRMNMTGINDMPVPSSASDLIAIVTRILRQNPIDWSLLRNYTGLDLMNLYNMSLTDMPIPNALRPFLSGGDFNMTYIPYVELLRPYLESLMNMDWESFDWNSTDFRNMSLPDSFRNILEFIVSTDWENFDTTVLESIMPASVQNILFIARHLDMTNLELIEFMLPLLPLPENVKYWIEMSINFDMQDIDVNQINVTALLPGEWKQYLMMLLNIDLESIRLSNVTDFLMPLQVREFLLLLNGTDWSSIDIDGILSLMMDMGWELPDGFDFFKMLNQSIPQNVQEMLQPFILIDWENFDWTNENITNLPIPPATSRFLIMVLRTDWENINWEEIDLSALSIPDEVKSFIFTMTNTRWDAVNWTGMVENWPIPQDNRDFLLMLMDAEIQKYIFDLLNQLMMMDWENFDWINAMPDMELEEIDWAMILDVLNLPILEDLKNVLLVMFTSSRENWDLANLDTSMLPDQLSEFLYLLESMDWENIDLMQAVDLMNLPIPEQIKDMLLMMAQIDWESFDWMNMDFTVIRELLGGLMNMDMGNFDWSEVIDLSGLPISDQMRMYLEMLITLDWENVEWSDVIDISGLPEPIKALVLRMMSMDWENIDMTELPMPDELRMYIMMITQIDWANIEWTRVIDLSGLPISDQMKLFLEMLMSMDWNNMSWYQIDLLMIPMSDRVREVLGLMMLVDWQSFDWAQVIDLSGLSFSDNTNLFLEELMRMDWENPDWSEMDFSRLPLSEEMRNMLQMMLTMDWNEFDWNQVIDLSGLPISDQMKLAIHWMMNMDWANTGLMDMDSMMERAMAFVHRLDSIVSDLLPLTAFSMTCTTRS